MRTLLINGTWVDAVSTAGREIKNPATLAPIDSVPDCGVQDVDRAVAAAAAAGPAWRKIPDAEKAGLLRAVGERIRVQRDALAALMTQESGTPLCESQDSVGWAADCFLRRAEALESRADAELVDGGQGGVTAALASFCDPLRAAARSAARALAAGRTVICKPPHQNPLAGLKLAEICALLPAGVLNVVTGAADAGAALIAHPLVGQVEFAGDAGQGTQIAALAAAYGKRLDIAAESAGPMIVLEDAPLDLAVPGVAWARLRYCGQGGGSRTRLYVQRSIAAQFADRIHEYMAFLEVGDPMKPDTD